MSLRRTKIEIIYDILQAINQRGGTIKPTHLMYKSNLSHKKLVEYTSELLEKGLIEEVPKKGGKEYKITGQGHKFTAEYRTMRQFIDSFGL